MAPVNQSKILVNKGDDNHRALLLFGFYETVLLSFEQPNLDHGQLLQQQQQKKCTGG